MHNESSMNGVERLPNGRIRSEYEAECHEFLERWYPKLYEYALYQVKGNHETARDLLHDTIVVLLEGRDKINFVLPPLAYMQLMIARQRTRHRKSPRKNFHNTFIYGEEDFNKSGSCPPYDGSIESLVHTILKQLKPSHQRMMECLLDKKKTGVIAKEFGVSVARVYQIQNKAFFYFRSLLAAQFPDVTLSDLGLQ